MLLFLRFWLCFFGKTCHSGEKTYILGGPGLGGGRVRNPNLRLRTVGTLTLGTYWSTKEQANDKPKREFLRNVTKTQFKGAVSEVGGPPPWLGVAGGVGGKL